MRTEVPPPPKKKTTTTTTTTNKQETAITSTNRGKWGWDRGR